MPKLIRFSSVYAQFSSRQK